MKINEVIIKPILTEKATQEAKSQRYTFLVNIRANKHQIKNAVETIYSVKVAEVRVLNRKGKSRRIGRRQTTKKLPTVKKALVTVKQGKIELFPVT